MTRRTLALVTTLLAVGVAAVATAARTGGSEQHALSGVSNEGRLVALQRGELSDRVGIRHAALLTVRAGRAFYRLEGKTGTCIGTGPAGDVGDVGAVDCPDGPFPTAARPVLDLSVYESASRSRSDLSLFRVEGIAADGVATVAFLRPNGRAALKVPVRQNVFASASVPSGPIAGLAAFGADGAELWRSP